MFRNLTENFLNIDSTPLDENCAQVGSVDTSILKLEAEIFRNQIERQFGPFPDGFRIKLNRNHHDFGTYFDLELYYIDEEDSPSLEKALEIEGNVPEHWDDQAREELQSSGYFMSINSSESDSTSNLNSLKAS